MTHQYNNNIIIIRSSSSPSSSLPSLLKSKMFFRSISLSSSSATTTAATTTSLSRFTTIMSTAPFTPSYLSSSTTSSPVHHSHSPCSSYYHPFHHQTSSSEFTGRGQQHTGGPVHPPHPFRSSLAVARSLSERSKEMDARGGAFSEGSSLTSTDLPQTKSYSDQIDEVMEQLNANCDFSIDDLYGTAQAQTSASTSTLNAPLDGGGGGKQGGGKKSGKGSGGGGGLTKKSNSTSQLSVSGMSSHICSIIFPFYSHPTSFIYLPSSIYLSIIIILCCIIERAFASFTFITLFSTVLAIYSFFLVI